MATYTVYVPSNIGGARQRADRTIFVREGFSRAAFVFGPLYLIYRRLWLAAIAWIVVAAALAFLSHALELPPVSRAILFLLLALLTGFEASVLRQAGLRRRGFIFAALLTKATLEQAERTFFAGEEARDAAYRASAAVRAREIPIRRPHEVIGLFPQAEGT